MISSIQGNPVADRDITDRTRAQAETQLSIRARGGNDEERESITVRLNCLARSYFWSQMVQKSGEAIELHAGRSQKIH